MPRPTSKAELLTANAEAYAQLLQILSQFSSSQLAGEFPFPHRDSCVRDVLAHLLAWQQLFLGWYNEGMADKIPTMPAEGYTWKTTPELNDSILQDYQSVSLDTVRAQLEATHSRLQQLIQGHTDEELFEKRRYHWTGSTSLGAYLTSAASAHYNWASKLLRKYKRLTPNLGGTP